MASRLLATVAVVLLAACSHTPAPAAHFRLTGEYAVHGAYAKSGQPQPVSGSACSPATVGYDDIRAGTRVVVRNGGGGVVATTALAGGTMRISGSFRDDCVFTFAASVPNQSSYQVEVGDRGTVSFSRAQLQQAHWKAALAIGNYSLGT